MNTRRLLGVAFLTAFAAFGAALVLSARARGGDRLPAEVERGRRGPASSGRTEAEEEAVEAASTGGLRVAGDEDAVESEARQELRDLYGDYRPYFVRGDFDFDGRLDFAQAFVRREGPEPLFDVAAFFGAEDGGFRPPVWVDRGLLLSGGDLSIDRSVLVVSEDVEQDVSRRWRWEPSADRFVDVDAEAGEGDEAPWVEPDLRTGTTA